MPTTSLGGMPTGRNADGLNADLSLSVSRDQTIKAKPAKMTVVL